MSSNHDDDFDEEAEKQGPHEFVDAEEVLGGGEDEDVVGEELGATAGAKRKARSGGPEPRADKKIRVSNARGLPYDIQRALAMEIEAMGGMEVFKKTPNSFPNLCDRNPAVFGLPGSKRRNQVRSKTKYWKTYTPNEYKSLIESFVERGASIPSTNSSLLLQQRAAGVMPYPMNQQAAGFMQPDCFPVKGIQHHPSDVYPPSKQPKGGKGQKGGAKAPPPQQLQQPFFPHQQQQQPPPPQPLVVDKDAPKQTKRKLDLPIGDDQKFETIEVDTKYPENNCGVGIFEFNDIEKGGYLHNGFEISMQGDIRDFAADGYKAILLGDSDILLRVPAVPYSFLYDSEEFKKRAKSADQYCAITEEAHDNARKRIIKDPSRQDRFILLEFPDEVKLTNRVFSPDSPDGELDFDLLPITINVELGGKELPMTITRISWKVSTVARQRRPVKKDEGEALGTKTTKGAAKLAGLF